MKPGHHIKLNITLIDWCGVRVWRLVDGGVHGEGGGRWPVLPINCRHVIMWRSGPESAQYVTWMNGDLGTMRSSLRIVITNNHPLQQSCSTNCSSNPCSFSEVILADGWSLLLLQLMNYLLYSELRLLSVVVKFQFKFKFWSQSAVKSRTASWSHCAWPARVTTLHYTLCSPAVRLCWDHWSTIWR